MNDIPENSAAPAGEAAEQSPPKRAAFKRVLEPPAPGELAIRTAFLKGLVSSSRRKPLPDDWVAVYAHYFSLKELHTLANRSAYIEAGSRKAVENPVPPEPAAAAQSPVRTLVEAIAPGADVRIPESVDFAMLFVQLCRDKAGRFEGVENQDFHNFAVSRTKFPLPVSFTDRFAEMIKNPTPEAAKVLSAALLESAGSTPKLQERLRELRKDPTLYLEKVAREAAVVAQLKAAGQEKEATAPAQPESDHPKKAPAEAVAALATGEVNYALVGRALRHLQRNAVKNGGEMWAVSNHIIAHYNPQEKRAAAKEMRGEAMAHSVGVQQMIAGKPIKNTKTARIAVGIANVLLQAAPQDARAPEVAAVLGDAPDFTSVEQLAALGQTLKDAAQDKGDAAGRPGKSAAFRR